MKKFSTVFLLSVLALTVTGCVPSAPVIDNGDGSDSSTSDSDGTVPEPKPEPTPDPVSYGDVVGTGEIYTDARGSYERIALPENHRITIYDPSNPLPDVEHFDWTDQEISEGLALAGEYLVTQYLDSTALDTIDQDELDKWRTGDATKYLDRGSFETEEEFFHTILMASPRAGTSPSNPLLVRDGKPRYQNVEIKIADGFAGVNPEDDTPLLAFKYDVKYEQRSTNEYLMSFYVSLDSVSIMSELQKNPDINTLYGKTEVDIYVGKDKTNTWKVYGVAGKWITGIEDNLE